MTGLIFVLVPFRFGVKMVLQSCMEKIEALATMENHFVCIILYTVHCQQVWKKLYVILLNGCSLYILYHTVYAIVLVYCNFYYVLFNLTEVKTVIFIIS